MNDIASTHARLISKRKRMAIKPNCDKCGSELKEFGGILFGPPQNGGEVKKNHLCVDCYNEIEKMLKK